MRKADQYHKQILKQILDEGYMDINPRPHYSDGTPAHTLSVNHILMKYDINKGEFPIITLRPIAWKSAVKEILWIYQKESNKLSDLHDLGIKYWDEWDVGDGTIGARYGETVRRHNLMKDLLAGLEKDPFGRRHILSLWQVDDFKEPGLNPCCFQTIWNVRQKGRGVAGMHETNDERYLDCMLIQRSSDFATSVSINEMQYVALQMMLARHLGIKPGVFTHVIANVQVYDRHIENARDLIARNPVECNPKLILKDGTSNFYDFTIDDFELLDYPLETIKAQNPQMKFDLGI